MQPCVSTSASWGTAKGIDYFPAANADDQVRGTLQADQLLSSVQLFELVGAQQELSGT